MLAILAMSLLLVEGALALQQSPEPRHAADASKLSKAQAAEKSVKNVKALVLAVLMFSQDSKGTFALNTSNWQQKTWPYVKDRSVYRYPDHPAASYAFNGKLAGKKLDGDPAIASKRVVVYEGRRQHLDFRHDGQAVVGFEDGHVDLIDAAQAKSILW